MLQQEYSNIEYPMNSRLPFPSQVPVMNKTVSSFYPNSNARMRTASDYQSSSHSLSQGKMPMFHVPRFEFTSKLNHTSHVNYHQANSQQTFIGRPIQHYPQMSLHQQTHSPNSYERSEPQLFGPGIMNKNQSRPIQTRQAINCSPILNLNQTKTSSKIAKPKVPKTNMENLKVLENSDTDVMCQQLRQKISSNEKLIHKIRSLKSSKKKKKQSSSDVDTNSDWSCSLNKTSVVSKSQADQSKLTQIKSSLINRQQKMAFQNFQAQTPKFQSQASLTDPCKEARVLYIQTERKHTEETLDFSSSSPRNFLGFSSVKKASFGSGTEEKDNIFNTTFDSNERLSMEFLKAPQITDFTLGNILGEGQFGKVYQAVHKKTKQVYALKQISKQKVKKNHLLDQLIVEIKIQTFIEHKNILKVFGCFADAHSIYLILEYMEGGTLFEKLQTKKKLKEQQVKQYIRQIARGVQCLHNYNIAHRDIKPQNIVLSHNLCKICDFGWSAICNDRRDTYCGTFDYVSPQILLGEPYDKSVDLWCIGILAFQLLVGRSPFYHTSRKQTMTNILNVDKYSIPYSKSITAQAKSFIGSLLKRNAKDRLTIAQALNHPFLR